jgi:hypothetical protein
MKNRFPREFYIPKGAAKVADKASTAVAYVYERQGVLYALGFAGKADKPSFHYRFRTAASREQSLRGYFDRIQRWEKTRRERAEARKVQANAYKVGDVLHTSWGYDQTNVEYFQVTEVRGKYVILREIGQERTETAHMQGLCVPMVDQFIGQPIRRLACAGSVKVDDVRRAYPTEYTEVAGLKVYRRHGWSSYA